MIPAPVAIGARHADDRLGPGRIVQIVIIHRDRGLLWAHPFPASGVAMAQRGQKLLNARPVNLVQAHVAEALPVGPGLVDLGLQDLGQVRQWRPGLCRYRLWNGPKAGRLGIRGVGGGGQSVHLRSLGYVLD